MCVNLSYMVPWKCKWINTFQQKITDKDTRYWVFLTILYSSIQAVYLVEINTAGYLVRLNIEPIIIFTRTLEVHFRNIVRHSYRAPNVVSHCMRFQNLVETELLVQFRNDWRLVATIESELSWSLSFENRSNQLIFFSFFKRTPKKN